MAIYCTYFGTGDHLRTTTICTLTPEDGELFCSIRTAQKGLRWE